MKQGVVPATMWFHDEAGHNAEAKNELRDVLSSETEMFITPKPTRLISRVLELASDTNSIVLDSFAGSGTTGHAVAKLNAADGGNRRYILVEVVPDIAKGVTCQRLERVCNGYADVKGNAVAGFGIAGWDGRCWTSRGTSTVTCRSPTWLVSSICWNQACPCRLGHARIVRCSECITGEQFICCTTAYSATVGLPAAMC